MLLFIAGQADHARAWMLRVSTSFSPLRAVFLSRSARLAVMFTVSCLLTLGLSLFFPLWVLALGPAFYGVPHLFSSLRYIHYTVSPGGGGARVAPRRQAYALLGSIMAVVTVYRLASPAAGLSEWRGSTYTEFFAMACTFAACAWIYRKRAWDVARGLLILMPVALGFYLEPFWTIGALVLAHNFVAFVYWWLAAGTRAEKGVALAAGIALAVLTALIFLGRLDGMYRFQSPVLGLDFARLSTEDIGRMIAPWAGDEAGTLWLHAAVAYAFGQAMHYFVWLKAIPDQYHRNEVPTSFRQSYQLLGEDFGSAWASRIVVLTLLSAGIWIFLSFPRARGVYFCLAAYHGYLEIAGLALTPGRGAPSEGITHAR
jgi:hypothetical protein